MTSNTSPTRNDAELREANRQFYDPLWTGAKLVQPHRFNTWPLFGALAAKAPRRLEVAPGLRPRLPLAGTRFVDISLPAIQKLRARGADAIAGLVSALPFADASFDLVCALDIVEHVEDDEAALAELARVAAPGAVFLFSAPLHPAYWTAFDDFVGHRRRYEPADILAKLARHGFRVEQSAVYGMVPKSTRLLRLGMWWLTHRRAQAMRWYNRLFMPLSVRFQKPLAFSDGMVPTENVGEVLLVCRKRA